MAPKAPRRTWRQRGTLVIMSLGAVTSLITAWLVQDMAGAVHSIERVPLSGVLDTVPERAGTVGPSTYLVVGVDGVGEKRTDEPTGPRSVLTDTIMIVKTDPASASAEVLPLPRDLWVKIPGRGMRKINAAKAIGSEDGDAGSGERLLVETIRANFGIAINHYVQIDFKGFASIFDSVGGVDLYMPAAGRDRNMGTWEQGCLHLDGQEALRLARSRKFQARVDGRWRSDPGGDLGRIRRQQFLIRLGLSKAIRRAADNPIQLRSLVSTSAKSLTLDDSLPVDDLIDMAMQYRDVDMADIVTNDLDVSFDFKGTASVDLLEDTAHNREVLAKFRTQGVAGDDELLPPLRATSSSSTSTSSATSTTMAQSSTSGGASGGSQAPAANPEDDPNYWFTPLATRPDGRSC